MNTSHFLRLPSRWRSLQAGLLAACLSLVSHAGIISDWNAAALNAIRVDSNPPPRASRALATLHVTLFDTLNGYANSHHPYQVNAAAPAGSSQEAALAAAGLKILSSLWVKTDLQNNHFIPVYQKILAGIPDGPAKTAGITWGESVANAIWAVRSQDGSSNNVPFTPNNASGHWHPFPPTQNALLPGWGNVKPFALNRGDQFRPPTPPAIHSAAFAFEFNAVKTIGSTQSATRTPNQTEVALFWADGAGTATPPGHWNVITRDVAAAKNLSLFDEARLFALVNIALADAAIAAWDAKYVTDYCRPVTAIREAANDGNPETEPDPNWTSLIATPPFPEYVSGHSTFSRAAASTLAAFFNTDSVQFSTTSDGLPNVTRSYTSFSSAADESGVSRLYGGIHWPSGNVAGQTLGHAISKHVIAHSLLPKTEGRFSEIARTANNTLLQTVGAPGRSYLLQASEDLLSWIDLARQSASTEGVALWNDSTLTPSGRRFYRTLAILE